MLVFMRLVGYVLYIYPAVEVLPCYRKVLQFGTGYLYSVREGIEVAGCALTFAYIDAIPGFKYRAFVR